MLTRSVTIDCGSRDTMAAAYDEAGPEQWFQAIGYLSYWAYHAYDKVSIWVEHSKDSGPELTARYSRAEDDKIYVLGAVWRRDEKKFSFHS